MTVGRRKDSFDDLPVPVWRHWPMWIAAVAGAVLLILVVLYPGVWWVLLLWAIPAGIAVGDARFKPPLTVMHHNP